MPFFPPNVTQRRSLAVACMTVTQEDAGSNPTRFTADIWCFLKVSYIGFDVELILI